MSLQELSLGEKFNQPVVGVSWPDSLQRLSFGYDVPSDNPCFNQPVDEVVWPASLEQLYFGGNFNQPVEDVVWPVSLRKLHFGRYFNQTLDQVLWPPSLRRLEFTQSYLPSVETTAWPASLEELDLGRTYHSMAGIVWPKSLKSVVSCTMRARPSPSRGKYLRIVEWVDTPEGRNVGACSWSTNSLGKC